MATRTGVPGTIVAAVSNPSAADINNLPGGELGYITVTSNQTGITTVTDLTSLTLTFTPATARIIRLDYAFNVNSNTASDEFQVRVIKDGSQVDRKNFGCSGIGNGVAVGWFEDHSPTNASHTYRLQMGQSGGSSGTFSVQASATQPAQFTAYDRGPDF